nr:hypothetical protein CFP56_14625 [Quercus suber]
MNSQQTAGSRCRKWAHPRPKPCRLRPHRILSLTSILNRRSDAPYVGLRLRHVEGLNPSPLRDAAMIDSTLRFVLYTRFVCRDSLVDLAVLATWDLCMISGDRRGGARGASGMVCIWSDGPQPVPSQRHHSGTLYHVPHQISGAITPEHLTSSTRRPISTPALLSIHLYSTAQRWTRRRLEWYHNDGGGDKDNPLASPRPDLRRLVLIPRRRAVIDLTSSRVTSRPPLRFP